MVLTFLFAYIAFAMGFYTLLVLRAPIIEDMDSNVLPIRNPEVVELFPVIEVETLSNQSRKAA